MRSLRSGKKNIFEREYSTGGADHGNCVGVCECSLTQLPPNTAARKSRPTHRTSATYKAEAFGWCALLAQLESSVAIHS